MNKLSLADIQAHPEWVIIDTRDADDFVNGFLRQSLFLANDEHFEDLLNLFADPASTIVLIGYEGLLPQMATKLATAGYNNLQGYLPLDYEAWQQQRGMWDMVITVDAYELAIDLPNDDSLVPIDVRSAIEYALQHLEGSQNLPLTDFADMAQIASLPETANIYLFCSNGNRSATACSILRQQGLSNIRWIAGGLVDMTQQQGLPMSRSKRDLN